jgi:hypothetical protein
VPSIIQAVSPEKSATREARVFWRSTGNSRRLLDSTEERKDFNEVRAWLLFCRYSLVRDSRRPRYHDYLPALRNSARRALKTR